MAGIYPHGADHAPNRSRPHDSALSAQTHVGLILLLLTGITTASAEVFQEDFNRPDGPLGAPWEMLGEDTLYIASEQAVANPTEFGLMIYVPDCMSHDVTLDADFSFNGDGGEGRFQYYIGAGTDESDARGFIGQIGIDFIRIRWFLPEEDLAFQAYDFSPTAIYKMRLAYSIATENVTLTIMDENGGFLTEIHATRSTDAMHYCVIGIENPGGANKWMDNVLFDHDCEIISVPDAGAEIPFLRSVPNPMGHAGTIRFELHGDQHVSLTVFDVAGRRIAKLIDRVYPAGHHEVEWDGRGDGGWRAPAGSYLVKLETERQTEIRRWVVIR